MAVRASQATIELAQGTVLLTPSLPTVHTLNALVLRAPLSEDLDAAGLIFLAERWFGHLSHRFVRLNDGAGAERLATEMLAAGWDRARTLFMAFRGDPPGVVADQRARQISEPEMQTLMRDNYEQIDWGADASFGLSDRLVEAQTASRRGTAALCFGAGEGGGLQSMTTLFLDPDVAGRRVAMVESVGTLPAYRERGLARAAVCAALVAARAWSADLIIVPADADDWPQLLYVSIGFEPIGIQGSFTLRAGTGHRRAAP